MIYLAAGLVVAVIALAIVVTLQGESIGQLQRIVGALERTAVLQQRYNDQIDADISRLEDRSREAVHR